MEWNAIHKERVSYKIKFSLLHSEINFHNMKKFLSHTKPKLVERKKKQLTCMTSLCGTWGKQLGAQSGLGSQVSFSLLWASEPCGDDDSYRMDFLLSLYLVFGRNPKLLMLEPIFDDQLWFSAFGILGVATSSRLKKKKKKGTTISKDWTNLIEDYGFYT